MIRFIKNNGDYLDIENKHYVYLAQVGLFKIISEKEYKVINLISDLGGLVEPGDNPILLIFKNRKDINYMFNSFGCNRIKNNNKIISKDAFIELKVMEFPEIIYFKNKYIMGEVYAVGYINL